MRSLKVKDNPERGRAERREYASKSEQRRVEHQKRQRHAQVQPYKRQKDWADAIDS